MCSNLIESQIDLYPSRIHAEENQNQILEGAANALEALHKRTMKDESAAKIFIDALNEHVAGRNDIVYNFAGHIMAIEDIMDQQKKFRSEMTVQKWKCRSKLQKMYQAFVRAKRMSTKRMKIIRDQKNRIKKAKDALN